METERLMMRRFEPGDWRDLYEYLSLEEVVRFEPYDIFSQEKCRRETVRRSQNDAFWAVCLKETNKLIGNVYLAKGEYSTWELGYVFHPGFQKRGYASEAVRALVDDVFRRQGAHRVTAMCNPENISSWKLLERLGMRREGHLLRNVYFKTDAHGNPIWLDTLEYAILALEWPDA